MERVVSATEARVHFGEVMRRVVETGQPVIVEKAGEPQVVMLAIQEYERLRAAPDDRGDWLSNALTVREYIERELAGKQLPAPEDIIREMREERSEHLYDLR